MRAPVFYSLFCHLLLLGGIALSSDEVSTAKNTPIFTDGFESGELSSWIVRDGDRDGTLTTPWAVVATDEAHGGSHVAGVSSVNQYNSCRRTHKWLVSPEMQHDGSTRLALSFWYKYADNPPAEVLALTSFKLNIFDENNVPVSGAVVDYGTSLPGCNSWKQFMLEITDAPSTFKLGFEFETPAGVCAELLLDDVNVIAIGDGLPDTRIVSPPKERQDYVKPGQTVVLEAEATSGAHSRFTWFISSQNTEPFCLTGTVTSFTPEEKGVYTIACYATDRNGLSDTRPAVRLLAVTDEHNLDTMIVAPMERRVLVPVGGTRQFTAASPSTAGNEDIGFAWFLAGGGAERKEEPWFGETIEVTFDKKGRFELMCSASDGDPMQMGVFRDPSPARIDIEVVDVLVQIQEPDAPGRIPELMTKAGETIDFVGSIEDPNNLVHRFGWLVKKGDEETLLCEGALTCSVTFEEAAVYTVVLVAMDQNSKVLGKSAVRYHVDQPLFLLVHPDEQLEVELGEGFTIEAMVKGLLEADPDTTVTWMFKGQSYPGPHLVIDEAAIPGHHQARVVVQNKTHGAHKEKRVMVMVHDPEQTGRPRITSPQSDWRIPKGGSLFFDSAFPQMPGHKINPYWEIVDSAETTVLVEGNANMLGRVTFDEEGTWIARLYVNDHNRKTMVDQVTIWVADDADIDGKDENSEIDHAAFVENGTYQGFALDRGHYYQIDVLEDQTLQVWVDPGDNEEAVVVFEDHLKNVTTKPVQGRQVLQIAGLPAGRYRWGVLPAEDGGKAKAGLNFSFGVNVFNPALYFTDINEDTDRDTDIGVVNITGSQCDVQLVAYDRDGNILDQVSRTLEGKGALRESVASMFPDTAGTVSWIRADSTHSVVGYAHTLSTDKTEAYGVNAAGYLQDELFVPHIAADTTTWATRASVVNGVDETIDSFLVAGAVEEPIGNNASFAKRTLDLVATLGGSVPENADWGRFYDPSGSATLAGNEIFGTVDGSNQIVGLGLFGGPADNPNFTATSETLYFTHIAQNENFWTGIALVNLANFELGVAVHAYGAGGTLLDTGTITMAAGDKQVWRADIFFQEAGISGDVQWMELMTEGNVVGYELFGTQTPGRLAGLEATSEANTSLCMPFVDVTGEQWHGLSVVNIGNAATTLTITLRDDVGGVVATSEPVQLNGKEKKIFLLSDLFGDAQNNLPLTGSWVEMSADQPIVGFELFGNQDQTHMSGLIAQ